MTVGPVSGSSTSIFSALGITDNLGDCGPEFRLVHSLQRAKLAYDEPLLDRGKYRFDCGRLQQTNLLPLADPNFTQFGQGTYLAGYRHHHHVRSGRIVGKTADDNRRPLS
jgi:hypothetical protein